MGCGSGRWARFVAPRAGILHCVDASQRALNVARRNLQKMKNCVFHCASVDNTPLPDNSMDFGYSLGVLHHVPDTAAALAACVRKLKPGAPFLVYLYYNFDNRPSWYRRIWQATDTLRRMVSRLPFPLRYSVSQIIAALVYYPLARMSLMLDKAGLDVRHLPLSSYRQLSFYSMRTDALDRFGTRLEKRFSRTDIRRMMVDANLDRVVFSESAPYWCALGYKRDIHQ